LFLLQLNKFLVIPLVISSALFAATVPDKEFSIEKGLVTYEIIGAGQLTPDVNITLKGSGKLRFNAWGDVALIEEKVKELTSGGITYINRVNVCEKFQHQELFDVDFERKKILKRKIPKGKVLSPATEGLEKTGQERIAGVDCDVWEGEGVRLCLHAGVPLLIEHYLLGVYYQKKATKIDLDIEISPSKCSIPAFPVQKMALLKNPINSKKHEVSKAFSQILLDVTYEMQKNLTKQGEELSELSDTEKQFWLDKLGNGIFEDQKVFLPEFLSRMKETRLCLIQAPSTHDANNCLLKVAKMKAFVNENRQNSIVAWEGVEKEETLAVFDESIAFLEPRMKCIRGAKKLSDLSACMRQ